jgi:phage baseplate assembly protein gpV
VSDYADALESAVRSVMSEMNTVAPGRVVSYDPATNRAVVQPVLPKRLADGTELPAPTIAEVPVIWPTSGASVFTMPIRAGDQVWLEFSQRSLDGWLAGNDAAPDDPRQFDMTDCIARPGGGRDVTGADPEAVVIRHGATTLRLLASGVAELTGNLLVTGDIVVTGEITSTGPIVGAGIGLSTHTHGETGTGGGTTMPPNG